jgi:hypothetical protein
VVSNGHVPVHRYCGMGFHTLYHDSSRCYCACHFEDDD